MNLIDTHAHLRWKDLENEFLEIKNNAIKKGLVKIVGVSSGLLEAKTTVALAKNDPFVVAGVGIHPQNTNPLLNLSLEEQLGQIAELAKEKEVVAIGECGFDFSKIVVGEEERPYEIQQEIFEFQKNLALELDKALIVHSRNAKEETLKGIKGFKGKGVWHCFVEDTKTAEIAINAGFYLSFNGILTYKSGKEIVEIVKFTPLEKILLETDSPFLIPEPLRSNPKIKWNQPAYVKIIAEKIAEIKNISFEEVANQSTENALKLFNIE